MFHINVLRLRIFIMTLKTVMKLLNIMIFTFSIYVLNSFNICDLVCETQFKYFCGFTIYIKL